VYLAIRLPISKSHQADKVFLMNKEKKLKDYYYQKLFMQFFWSGICYLLNLLKGFQNPARKPASC